MDREETTTEPVLATEPASPELPLILVGRAISAVAEYGKATFLGRLGREIERVKAAYPQAR